MTKKLSVSVVIVTYRRAYLLRDVFDALANQTYKDFDVVVVLKPSGDKSEETIEKFTKVLKIKRIIQEKGNLMEAMNLGLENAKGDIIAFIDDDAVPFPDWLQNLVETYNAPYVGGVAGDVIPTFFTKKGPIQINQEHSEIIPEIKPFMHRYERQLWNRPLVGLEDYFVYLSKAGIVSYNFDVAMRVRYTTSKSLLGMGANMSVLAKALDGFRFDHCEDWIFGLSYEQLLGWYVWKKGYTLFFNPDAKVCHIAHGQTLTRNIIDKKRRMLGKVEANLLFYRLYGVEPGLSFMYRTNWLIFSLLVEFKKIGEGKETSRIATLKSYLYSEIIGLTWILSRKFGGNYTPIRTLKRFIHKNPK